MAHMVVTDRAAFTGKPAWHREGKIIMPDESGRIPRPLRFIEPEYANMAYDVLKTQAYRMRNDGTIEELDNQFNLTRSDDEKVLSGSTVTKIYEPVNPKDLAEVLEPFYNDGFGNMDAAFCLYAGRAEVLSFRLDMNVDVAGDNSEYHNFLVIYNHHGSGSVRMKLIRFRVVCHNTLTAGMAGGCDLKFRHTKSIHDKLAFARNYWKEANEVIREHSKKLGLLMTTPCNVPNTVDELLGIRPNTEITTQKQNKRDRIIMAARQPYNNGSTPNTLGSIYQGVTWINTHDVNGKGGKNLEDRMESQLDGNRADFENEIWGKLLALAGI